MTEVQLLIYALYHKGTADYEAQAIIGNIQSPEPPFRPATVTCTPIVLDRTLNLDVTVTITMGEIYFINDIYAIPQRVKFTLNNEVIADIEITTDGLRVADIEAEVYVGTDVLTRPEGQFQREDNGISYYTIN